MRRNRWIHFLSFAYISLWARAIFVLAFCGPVAGSLVDLSWTPGWNWPPQIGNLGSTQPMIWFWQVVQTQMIRPIDHSRGFEWNVVDVTLQNLQHCFWLAVRHRSLPLGVSSIVGKRARSVPTTNRWEGSRCHLVGWLHPHWPNVQVLLVNPRVVVFQTWAQLHQLVWDHPHWPVKWRYQRIHLRNQLLNVVCYHWSLLLRLLNHFLWIR